MAVDITNGDVLVVGTEEYPIRAVSFWAGAISAGGFARLATLTASTKRSPAVSGGKVGTPVVKEASLICTPLDPIDPEIRQRLGLDTPHELLQTYIPDNPNGFFYLVLEELKR